MFSLLKYHKVVKNIVFLLILACNCSESLAQSNTSLEYQLYQKTSEKPVKQSWLYGQLSKTANLAERCFSSTSLLGGAKYNKSNESSISYLRHMLDDNDLSVTLEAFKESNVFEVLAMVYVSILLNVDELEQDIINAGITPPDWIVGFSDVTQEVKKQVGGCLPKSKTTEFTRLTIKEQRAVEDQLNARARQCCSKLQALLQDHVKTNEAATLIRAKLDKQVSLLMSRAKNNTHFFNEVILKSPRGLVDILSTPYVVATISNTPSEIQYPVLEALVNWGARNSDSLISKLLDDSKRWVTQDYHLTAEENKTNGISAEEKVFFSYLHYNSKDVTEVWHGANESLRDCEAREIANTLLASDVIKNLSDQFKTVQQLNVIYQSGFVALDAMHSNLEQQESLNPEDQAKTKKDKQNGSFGQEDWDEYLKEGLKKNMKDSLLGKVASGINYVFNVVKNGFTAPPTKQEQSKKIMTAWVNMVQKNALHLTDSSDNKGIQLVMAELIKIDSLHKEGDITIKDALTTLVAQDFTSLEKEQVFTLLTGLQRKADIRQKTYCYQPLVTAASDKNANDCELQYEQADQPIDIPASGNAFAKHNNAEEKHRDWLSMPTNDYTLQKSKSQNDVAYNEADGSYESDGTNTTKSSPLHVDWCFININYEEKNEDQARGQRNTVWIGSSYNSSFYNRLLMGAVVGLCVLAVVDSATAASSPQAEAFFHNHTQAHNSSNLNSSHSRHIRDVSSASASNVIGISNVTELNLIGNHADYPSNGNYKLTASFNVKGFTRPIPEFTGNFNGNCETIDELPCCLINKLSGNGIVQNINFNNVDTRSATCDPAVANVMVDSSIVRFIQIENGRFEAGGHQPDNIVSDENMLGMVINEAADASCIEHIIIKNSNITGSKNSHYVGGVVGRVKGSGSQVAGIYIDNIIVVSVVGVDESYAGGVFGAGYGVSMHNITIMDSIIRGESFYIGGVGGAASHTSKFNDVNIIRVALNSPLTRGYSIGGMLGFCGPSNIASVTVSSSIINVNSEIAYVGGIIGRTDSTLKDITVIDTVINIAKLGAARNHTTIGGGIGYLLDGIISKAVVINTTISAEEAIKIVPGTINIGWEGRISNAKLKELLVGNNFLSINKPSNLTISNGVGLVANSEISNFKISNSRVLLLVPESDARVGFCMEYKTDVESYCDFNKAKKLFSSFAHGDNSITYIANADSTNTDGTITLTANIHQWASLASASSEYDLVDNQYLARYVAGTPDTGLHVGDDQAPNIRAWAEKEGERHIKNTLELTYTTPVKIIQIVAREILNAGTISKMEVLKDDVYVTAYSNDGATETGGTMSGVNPGKVSDTKITLDSHLGYFSNKIKITVGNSVEEYNEIDAVKLIGAEDDAPVVTVHVSDIDTTPVIAILFPKYGVEVTNPCRWNKLFFINYACEVKPEEFYRYQHPAIEWNESCSVQTQAPILIADSIATEAAGVLIGAVGASSLSYFTYHLYKKYKEGNRGRELLQKALLSACCKCCDRLDHNEGDGCLGHSGLPTEESGTTDDDDRLMKKNKEKVIIDDKKGSEESTQMLEISTTGE
ncbi:MAG: hypothetical protein QS721_15240 [Candidatus Endonucleobacter sp. (ex Gigantidas childressi)]|nr:hypothetical protein [Candidatus Endonucleobacter sp. (ex Gigantidas childressi)]